MISYLSGTVLASSNNSIIVDTGGVGYRVVIPKRMHSSLSKPGTKVNLYTYTSLNMREGSFDIFGFSFPEELFFFQMLISVSGIGPKAAQAILSEIDLQTLQMAIIREDDSYLKKISGIGAKTAQRIILELKNKVMSADIGVIKDADFEAEGDAIDVMVALGYSVFQAREALKEVSENAGTIQEKIKEALKILGAKK